MFDETDDLAHFHAANIRQFVSTRKSLGRFSLTSPWRGEVREKRGGWG